MVILLIQISQRYGFIFFNGDFYGAFGVY